MPELTNTPCADCAACLAEVFLVHFTPKGIWVRGFCWECYPVKAPVHMFTSGDQFVFSHIGMPDGGTKNDT